jgi:small subunit ribosomal protein S17
MADESHVTQEQSTQEQPARTRGVRATRTGEVVSAKQDKTIVVRVTRKVPHPMYSRFIKKSTKLYAHDEENTAGIGDTVRVVSTRPLSKLKRWRLVEILERAK